MRLRVVILSPLLRRPRGIEIPQAHHRESMLRTELREQPLEIPFRLAVRVDRRLRGILRNRYRRRVAVHGAGGREDKAADLGASGGLQQYTGGGHIVGHILARLGHRLRHERESGQMDDRFDALTLEQRLDQLAVSYSALDEPRASGDGLAVPRTQVVEHDDVEATFEELIYENAADVSCPAGHEHASGHAGGSIPNRRRSASSSP